MKNLENLEKVTGIIEQEFGGVIVLFPKREDLHFQKHEPLR